MVYSVGGRKINAESTERQRATGTQRRELLSGEEAQGQAWSAGTSLKGWPYKTKERQKGMSSSEISGPEVAPLEKASSEWPA